MCFQQELKIFQKIVKETSKATTYYKNSTTNSQAGIALIYRISPNFFKSNLQKIIDPTFFNLHKETNSESLLTTTKHFINQNYTKISDSQCKTGRINLFTDFLKKMSQIFLNKNELSRPQDLFF